MGVVARSGSLELNYGVRDDGGLNQRVALDVVRRGCIWHLF